jgi:hypothetical protein
MQIHKLGHYTAWSDGLLSLPGGIAQLRGALLITPKRGGRSRTAGSRALSLGNLEEVTRLMQGPKWQSQLCGGRSSMEGQRRETRGAAKRSLTAFHSIKKPRSETWNITAPMTLNVRSAAVDSGLSSAPSSSKEGANSAPAKRRLYADDRRASLVW